MSNNPNYSMRTTGTLAHKASAHYANKVVIAEVLAGFGVRAVTITAVARVRPTDARAIYTRFVGSPSRSGRTPTSHKWFLGSRSLRLQSAFVLLTFAMYRQQYEGEFDAHGISFVLTLYNYQSLYRNKGEISGERMALLINDGFGARWRQIPTGGTSDFEHDNVKILKCRGCALPHLVEAHKIGYTCESCLDAAKDSATPTTPPLLN
jgi:hypothetical protein